jgi:hypothetical protein
VEGRGRAQAGRKACKEQEEAREVNIMGVIMEALDAQRGLQIGQEGWWEVWGASTQDIREGDMVMVRYGEPGSGDISEYLIQETTVPDGLADICAPRFVTQEGVIRIGMLQKIALLRKGTHHTLSDTCR